MATGPENSQISCKILKSQIHLSFQSQFLHFRKDYSDLKKKNTGNDKKYRIQIQKNGRKCQNLMFLSKNSLNFGIDHLNIKNRQEVK